MAGLRLVYSPSGILSTSAKIAFVSRSSSSAVVRASWSAGTFSSVSCSRSSVSGDSNCSRMRSCHIAITSCTG